MSTRLKLNPLQVQWLADSQIDYLWGQPLSVLARQSATVAPPSAPVAPSPSSSLTSPDTASTPLVATLTTPKTSVLETTVMVNPSSAGVSEPNVATLESTVISSASPAKTDIRHLMQQTGLMSATELVNKPIVPKETNLFYAPQLLALLQAYSAGEFKIELEEPIDNPWNGVGVTDSSLFIVDMVPSYQTTNVQLGLVNRQQSLFQAIAYDLGWDIQHNLYVAHLSKSTLEDQEQPDLYRQRCLWGLLNCLQQTRANTLLIMGQSPHWFTDLTSTSMTTLCILERTMQVLIAPSPVQLLLNTQARQSAWNSYCQATTLANKELLC